jgi:4-hydroxybenzoate polyprenyltransferase
MMENAAAFVVSLLTVIIIVVTIAIFMLYGAGSYFYAGAVISIALGFIDTWLVSREKPYATEMRHVPAKRKNRRNRKASKR